MNLPRSLFEDEDIIYLEHKLGAKLKKDSETVSFTTDEWTRFEGVINENIFGGPTTPGMKNLPVLRAAAMILAWERQAKTVADKASLLSAALAVAIIDPSVGTRLVNSIRLSIK